MSMRNAAKMSAIMNGLKAGREERRDIAEKRIQKQRETEEYEYKKKTHKLDLENKRRTGQISDMELKVETERLAPLFKAIEARDKLQNNWIDDAEKRNSFGMKSLGQVAQQTALELARVSQDTIRNVKDKKVQSELANLSKDKTKFKDTEISAVYDLAIKMTKANEYGRGTFEEKLEENIKKAREMIGLGEVETKKTKTTKTIKMKAPNGKIWNIDADKVSNAEGRGATRL